jgi:lysozyme family protein
MADINAATVYVLKNEDSHLSGKVTTDRGGMTRYGIAAKFHRNLNPCFYTCPGVTALAMAEALYASEYADPLQLAKINSQPIANKLLDIAINCGVPIAAKFAQEGVNALGYALVVDEHVGSASVTAINAVDAGALMAELVSESMAYYTKLNEEGKASPDEYAAWMTRAAKRGV